MKYFRAKNSLNFTSLVTVIVTVNSNNTATDPDHHQDLKSAVASRASPAARISSSTTLRVIPLKAHEGKSISLLDGDKGKKDSVLLLNGMNYASAGRTGCIALFTCTAREACTLRTEISSAINHSRLPVSYGAYHNA